MFFPLFPPSLLFAPWSLCGKHTKAGAGSTARRQKRRIIGLVYQVSPPPCLEPILPEKHALLPPHAFITFSELENTACYSVPGPTDWNLPGDTDSSNRPPAESRFCRGGPARRRPEWRDSPAHARIIRFSCDMDFRRYAGAQRSAVYSHNDV